MPAKRYTAHHSSCQWWVKDNLEPSRLIAMCTRQQDAEDIADALNQMEARHDQGDRNNG